MATALPQYRRSVVANGVGPNATLQLPVGPQALGNLAGTLGAVGEKLKREQDQKEREDAASWTANAMSAAHVTWADRIQKMQDEAPLGAPGFAGQVGSAFTEFKAEQVKQAPNEVSKRFIAERMDALGATLFAHAVGFEAKQGVDYRNDQWAETRANVAAMAARNPEQAKVMLAESDATLQASQHQAWAADQRVKLKSDVSVAAVQGLIERDPMAAEKALSRYFGVGKQAEPEQAGPPAEGDPQRIEITGQSTAGFFVKNLTPQQAHVLLNQAQTEVRRIAAEGRYELGQRTKDVQAATLSGVALPPEVVPTVEEYKKLHGPSGAAMWQQEVGNYIQVGGAFQAMKTASPQERAAMIAGAKPEAEAGYAGKLSMQQAMIQANKLVEQQIAADPATYVLQTSERAKIAAQGLAEALSPQTTFANENSKRIAQAAAVSRYAGTLVAEQQRLGVDVIRDEKAGNKPVGPKLLTNAQANGIMDQIASTAQGGLAMVDAIQSQAQQWGQYWPMVYGQLASENKLSPAALVIPNMKDRGSQERLARLSTIPDEELKKGLEQGDAKDIDTKLLSAMEPFWNTLAVQGGGEKTYETVRSQAARLAYSYKRQGKSVGDAVAQAFEETVAHQYAFESTYRVPKKEQPEQIVKGVAQVKRHLEDIPFLIPPVPGVKPAEAKAQWLNSVRANAVFATTEDESGVYLYVQNSGGLTPAMTAQGRVKFTWQQLRDEFNSTQGKPSFRISKP